MSWFSLVNPIVGALMGWRISGARAGYSIRASLGYGITTVAATVFWCLFIWAGYLMVEASMRLRYDGPMEALTGHGRHDDRIRADDGDADGSGQPSGRRAVLRLADRAGLAPLHMSSSQALFFYGTLRYRPLLDLVLGPAGAARVRLALRGCRGIWRAGRRASAFR